MPFLIGPKLECLAWGVSPASVRPVWAEDTKPSLGKPLLPDFRKCSLRTLSVLCLPKGQPRVRGPGVGPSWPAGESTRENTKSGLA